MNAAARAIQESNVFNGHIGDMRLSKELCLVLALLVMVLVSAWFVIYVTNEHRSSFSTLEQLEEDLHELKLQWGKLLLEQASLETPARVEEMAIEKLQMQLPEENQTFVLQSP